MRRLGIAGAGIGAALLLAPALAAAQPGSPEGLVSFIPLDGEATVAGIPAACTGLAQTREDPRWAAYPVRVEFSNARNEYLMGAVVQVRTAKGAPVLNAQCDGPWLLLKLPPGRYVVQGRLTDIQARPRSARVDAPASGQVRVVLQFTDVDAPPPAPKPAEPPSPPPG